MTMDEYIAKYGTRSTSLLVSLLVAEFNKRAPVFMHDEEFTDELDKCMADLESALQDYVDTACIPGDT